DHVVIDARQRRPPGGDLDGVDDNTETHHLLERGDVVAVRQPALDELVVEARRVPALVVDDRKRPVHVRGVAFVEGEQQVVVGDVEVYRPLRGVVGPAT